MSDYNNHTTKQIHELYQDVKEGRLILQPDFQRRLVWSGVHKAEFIETILKEYPFPEIYIADSGINLTNISSQKVVVDGQQRMDTIISYIDGTLDADKKVTLTSFDDLPDASKTKFLGYQVNVCNIFGADEETIKEIFRRINLTRYPLNPYEINNAVYDGKFIAAAKELAAEINWDDFGVLTMRDISRMRDLGLILNFMSLVEEGGYFAYDDLVQDYIQRYNDEYEQFEKTKSSIRKAFELVKSLGLDKKSMWLNKSNFYTMIAEFIFNEKNLPSQTKLKQNLKKFEGEISKNKDATAANDFSTYYAYNYAGTNKRAERAGRGQIFRKHILGIE